MSEEKWPGPEGPRREESWAPWPHDEEGPHSAAAGSTGGGDERGEADLGPVAGRPGGAGRDRTAGGPAAGDEPAPRPRTSWKGRPTGRKRRRVREVDAGGRRQLSPRQRLLILDSWLRSKLPAHDFAAMVGVSPHTLYAWNKRFREHGPAGLEQSPRKGAGTSRLPEATRRAIVMLKQAHPEWGERRIHDVLLRSQGYSASPRAVARVLELAGYVSALERTRPHPPRPTRFERARPNQLWQTDLFTFVLKREGRRVHLVAYMDDHSRYIVGYGLHASASGALVREVFESAALNFSAPEEVLTDNGTQYHTWRGKSDFTRLLEKRGIRQIVAAPRHPQTLGKIERFWQTLWSECIVPAIFRGLDDARRRIGLFIDHYNFQRPHQGIEGLVPADRYFAAAPEVRETLRRRVAGNALDLARNGEPRKPFYLTGRVGSESISLHAEGERVVMMRADGTREEVDLGAPGQRADSQQQEGELPASVAGCAGPPDEEATLDSRELAAPGTSELDTLLERLEQGLCSGSEDEGGDDDAGEDGGEDDDELGGAVVAGGGGGGAR